MMLQAAELQDDAAEYQDANDRGFSYANTTPSVLFSALQTITFLFSVTLSLKLSLKFLFLLNPLSFFILFSSKNFCEAIFISTFRVLDF